MRQRGRYHGERGSAGGSQLVLTSAFANPHNKWKTYSDADGTALAALLDGQRVRLTEVGTPVTSPDGQNAELGNDNGGTDRSRDFLGGLDAETNVALGVTDDDDGLEPGALTGTGLLLDGLDL